MNKITTKTWISALALAIFIVFGHGLVIFLLWNSTLSALLPLPEITYWQAVSLKMLIFALLGDTPVLSSK